MLPRKKEEWEKAFESMPINELRNLITTIIKLANDKEKKGEYKLVKRLKPDSVHPNYEKWQVTGKIFASDWTPNILYRKVDAWGEIDWCLEYEDSKSLYRLPDEIGDKLSVARHKMLKNKSKETK